MRRAAAQTLVLLRRGQSGAVAQLGERYNGIVEVVSSILIGSTIKTPRETLGFCQFWAMAQFACFVNIVTISALGASVSASADRYSGDHFRYTRVTVSRVVAVISEIESMECPAIASHEITECLRTCGDTGSSPAFKQACRKDFLISASGFPLYSTT